MIKASIEYDLNMREEVNYVSNIEELQGKNIRFKCELKTATRNEKWQGEIKGFINYGSHYEIFIESRSSIQVLFGKTSRGSFACMPDFEAGCHLIELRNKFWNQEKLCSALGLVDGITVATALCELSTQYSFLNSE